MTESRTEIMHFRTEGAAIMNLARNAYWFENRREWALDLLGTLQGMTVEQAMKVLRGDAVLSGIDSQKTRIQYVEKPDKAFKAEVEKHVAHLKQKADEEARERIKENEDNERRAVLREDGFGALREFVEDQKPEPITDPTELGPFTVSKDTLTRYLDAYVEHNFAPMNLSSIVNDNAILMRLHKQLRESVGLSGYWGIGIGSEPDDFDKELQTVAHEAIEKDKRTLERRRLARAGIGPNEPVFTSE